jgi:hypothetical protein
VAHALIWPRKIISPSNFHGTNAAHKNTNMNRVVLGVVLGLALSSQAWAIIRPPFPAKPAPPYRGHVIIIGEDSIQQAPPKPAR